MGIFVRSTIPPQDIENLYNTKKLYEEWLHCSLSNNMRMYKSFMFHQKSLTTNHCDNGINGNNMEENILQHDPICPVDVFYDEYVFDVQQTWNPVTDTNTKMRDGFENQHKMIWYSPDIAFQVHLLRIVSVRGIPMNMFDKIMDVIFVHCVKGNLDFNTTSFNYTQNGLFTRWKKIHGMANFVVSDTVEIVMNMLEDPRIV